MKISHTQKKNSEKNWPKQKLAEKKLAGKKPAEILACRLPHRAVC
jgi:hypothetical protein